MVGFWATLSLNIPDFTRYARSQRDQVLGQALGLPLTMALYSFIGVAVTSATKVIYGKMIWDPVDVLTRFKNPVVLVDRHARAVPGDAGNEHRRERGQPGERFCASVAKKDFVHDRRPDHRRHRHPEMPWKLVADPTGYIYRWLVAYSALLGAIGGILIADYYLLRRTRLDLKALYQSGGEYWYSGGFNPLALSRSSPGSRPASRVFWAPSAWSKLLRSGPRSITTPGSSALASRRSLYAALMKLGRQTCS